MIWLLSSACIKSLLRLLFSHTCVNINENPCMFNMVADAQLRDRASWGELQSLPSFPLVFHMLQMQMAFNRKHESTDVSFLHGLVFTVKAQNNAVLEQWKWGNVTEKGRTMIRLCVVSFFHRVELSVYCVKASVLWTLELISSGSIQSKGQRSTSHNSALIGQLVAYIVSD